MGEKVDKIIQKVQNVPGIELLKGKFQLYVNYTDKNIFIGWFMKKLKHCDEYCFKSSTIKFFQHSPVVVLHEKINSISLHQRQLAIIPCTYCEAMSCLKSTHLISLDELDTFHEKQMDIAVKAVQEAQL